MKIIFVLCLLTTLSVFPFSFAQENEEINYLQQTSIEKIQEKKYNEALSFLDKIIELDPNNIFAYNNKGAILIEQEKYDESIFVLEKSLAINENNTEAWNNKGIAHSKKLDYSNALFSFFNSLKADSKNQVAYDNTKKLSEILPLLDYSEFGYGVLQVRDSNGILIGSSRIHTIGLLPEIGFEVFKDRSKTIEVNGKNFFIFHDTKLATSNEYVGGFDIKLFKGSEEIVVGEIKTHGFIARAGNYYTYDIILADI